MLVYQEKYAKQWRYAQKNKVAIAEKRASKTRTGYYKEYFRKYYSDPVKRKKLLFFFRRYNERRNDALFTILGSKCANPDCPVPNGCTDRRCLQLDHIKDDGIEDRKRFRNSKQYMLLYYINHPDEAKQNLQILCANCNTVKEYERVKAIRDANDKKRLDEYEELAEFYRRYHK